METVINDYISRELVQDPALLPLADETSLLESGILDSLSLLRLVVFLEERFGITMGEADLLPENFASVNTICAYLRAREPGKQQAALGDNRAWKLLRKVEGVAYWAASASVLARLPAALGYRIACWRGDWLFRCRPRSAQSWHATCRLVLGNELNPAAAQQVTRESFRLASCEAVDLKRLRNGRGR